MLTLPIVGCSFVELVRRRPLSVSSFPSSICSLSQRSSQCRVAQCRLRFTIKQQMFCLGPSCMRATHLHQKAVAKRLQVCNVVSGQDPNDIIFLCGNRKINCSFQPFLQNISTGTETPWVIKTRHQKSVATQFVCKGRSVSEDTFRITYSLPWSFSSVPAYLEYTTFSPSCTEHNQGLKDLCIGSHFHSKYREGDKRSSCFDQYLDSLGCACLLHVTLCGLLLCAGRKEDASNRLLLTDVHLDQHTLAYWCNSFVLRQDNAHGHVACSSDAT